MGKESEKYNTYVYAHRKVKVTQSCPTLWPPGLCSPRNSPGQNTGVGNLSLLQRIFPTQGQNPRLLHCRQMYQLSSQGNHIYMHDWLKLNGHEFEETLGDSEGQGRLVCCRPCCCKKLDVTFVTEQQGMFMPESVCCTQDPSTTL